MNGVPVGSIAGIPLRLDWSLAVIFWLLTWGLASQAFPELAPGYSTGVYWFTGAVTAVLFLLSLLAHEMSHSLVARRAGIEVESITLWLFGGVASLRGEATNPEADFRIAAVGPLTSLAIGVGAGSVAVALWIAGAPDLTVTVAGWLGSINVLLAVFNMAPAAPLDGGRILRAWLWKRRGDRLSAAVSATRAGRVFGYVLIGLGLLQFAAGAGIGGLWLVFLGWFVMTAANNEEYATRVTSDLAGVKVRDVMTPGPVTAPAHLTVEDMLDQFVLRHRCSAFPLTARDGHVVGLVTLNRLKQVPQAKRATTLVGETAWALAEIPTAGPDDMLIDLVSRLGEQGDGRSLVFTDGRLVGIVTPTDVSRALQLSGLRRTPTEATPMRS